MFEASLNCGMRPGAIRDGLTTPHNLSGHEKSLL